MSIIKKVFLLLVAFAGGGLMSSCTSIEISEYKNQKPDFEFENFFSGNLEAHGFFQDRSGKVVKTIRCIMKAEKKGGAVIIEEDFEYSDGVKEHRQWVVKKDSNGKYVATAGDVVGDAKIETSGFAFNMKYLLKLKVDSRSIEVKMDDWMYRVSENTVINKTKMSKWGFYLGEVTFVIVKK